MCVSITSTTFVWNIFHSRNNWAKYNLKHLLIFMLGVHYSCPILMKLEFSRQIFEKYSDIIFHDYPSSESWDTMQTRGRTDGQTWRSW